MPESPIIYRLKSRSTPGPNSRYSIDRPDLGFVGTGYIFDVLVKDVEAWRKSNGIPIGLSFEDDLEQAICKQYPNCCETEDARAPVEPVQLGLKEVILGTKVMIAFIKSGFKVVDHAEAERRAAICSKCRWNVHFQKGCGGNLCGELLDVVKRIVPRGTSRDEELKACGICHCLLQASVWIDRQVQWDPMSDNLKTKFQYNSPKECWKKSS